MFVRNCFLADFRGFYKIATRNTADISTRIGINPAAKPKGLA